MRRWMLTAALLALLPGGLTGQEVRGLVSLEARSFPRSPLFDNQERASVSPSAAFEPELLGELFDGRLEWTVRPFLRVDGHDAERTHVDLREASVLYFAESWTLFAGVGKVFWGKAEAHHLVDVVNQTDAVEDIDNEDKLGQPMVSLTLEGDWGALDLMYLPYFRERSTVGEDARLRGALPVAEDAVYESDADRWHPDFAARWSHFVGDLDFAVSAFRGTSREPRLTLGSVGASPTLVAHYDIISQLAVEGQWTRGATLWKVEALVREGHGDTFLATVAGVEHTLYGLGSGATDLGLLAEVMLDGRDDTAPIAVFDHDLFFGARWAWNDAADSSILGGPVIDLETGELIAFVEAERRVADRWTAEIEARWFGNTSTESVLSGFRRDGFLTVRMSRHF